MNPDPAPLPASPRQLSRLSVVVPGLNEQDSLPHLHAELVRHLGARGWELEILFVDDGSTDGTLAACRALHAKDPRFQYLSLSRNFGHQRALTAGLDLATGDAVVAMDADLQDPPEVVLEMVARWQEGVDVAFGQRRSREGESWFKRATAAAFYRIARILCGIPLPADVGDFRLMDRRVVDALRGMREQGRFMRGLVCWVGYRQEPVLYDRKPRKAGVTKYPLRRMLRFAWDGILSFSIVPLRLAIWAGVAVSGASFLYAVYYLFRRLFFNDLVPGWASLVIAIMFFGGLQMLFTGLLGEYLARTFEESKGRPLYLVRETTLRPTPTPAPPAR